MKAMLQFIYLFLVVSAVSALKGTMEGFHDTKYELLKDYAKEEVHGYGKILIDIILDQQRTIKGLEAKVNIIIDQGNTIKTLETKVNTLTETVNQQGGQIRTMQEQITDMETVIERQNQNIADLVNEKDVLTDTIMGQKAEFDSMRKNIMMENIDVIHLEDRENLKNNQKAQKGMENGHTLRKNSSIPSQIILASMKNSKGKNNAAAKETVGRVLAGNRDANEISNDKNGKVFHTKNEKQSVALENGLDRVQKRTVTHVAFSTYLSHELNHLSIGHVIKMDQTFINDGNGYNQNTGIFTVPTSGVYLLTYSIENTHKTHITKTSPCNEHPPTPHFYIVKLGFTGVYFFLIFAPKHRLWVLVRTASLRRF